MTCIRNAPRLSKWVRIFGDAQDRRLSGHRRRPNVGRGPRAVRVMASWNIANAGVVFTRSIAVAIVLSLAPDARAGPVSERIEQSIRREADEMEQRMLDSGMVVTAPALNNFVARVGCAIAGAKCDELRFYVLDTPSFNAGMAPNGMMVINSGLLLRIESEAELAFVMAHEYRHYEGEHTLGRVNAMRDANASGVMLMMGLSLAGAGAYSSLGYSGAILNVFSFSRDQERAADLFASEFANANIYDSHAGVRAWRNLRTEMLASSDEFTRERYSKGSIFSTHPMTDERIAYLAATERRFPGAGEDKMAYRAMIRPHLQDWLEAEVQVHDAGASFALFDRLALLGTDQGVIEYARGAVYRARGMDGDRDEALARFRRALTHEDGPAAAWREIGLLEHAANSVRDADQAFMHYLIAAPDAPDRHYIESLLYDQDLLRRIAVAVKTKPAANSAQTGAP